MNNTTIAKFLIVNPTTVRGTDWVSVEAEKLMNRLSIATQTNRHLSRNKTVLFQAGFGPSGLPHIGTLCEAMRTSFVQGSLEALTGMRTKLVIVSDDMDALRKIPDHFPNADSLNQYLGYPLCRVPDPFEREKSFSEGINRRLESVLDRYEIQYELIRSSESYVSGEYDTTIRLLLKHYSVVNDIVLQSVGPIRQQSYSILMPISTRTGRVIEHIRVLEVDSESGEFTYEIPKDVVIQKPGLDYGLEAEEFYVGEKIGVPIKASALSGACKLQWKADWAMRLIARGVDYEMHGEDLTASAAVVQRIISAVGITPPIFFVYGLFRDEAGRKISKSKGNGFSLEQMERYLTPDGLRRFLHRNPRKSRRFSPALTSSINDTGVEWAETTNYLQKVRPAIRVSPVRGTFTQVLRIIEACSPMDAEAASAFIHRYPHMLSPDIEPTVSKAWMFYEDQLRPRRPKLSFTQCDAPILEGLSMFLEDHMNSITDLLDAHWQQWKGEYSKPRYFRLIMYALTQQTNGPKIGTWISIHGRKRSCERLTDFAYELRQPKLSLGLNAEPNSSLIQIKLPEQGATSTILSRNVFMSTTTDRLLTDVDFLDVERRARHFARVLVSQAEAIIESLADYECRSVAEDEIIRSTDFLENLHINREYFARMVRGVTTFLPLNQPLYATICFGVVPSFIAQEVHVRPPTAMQSQYRKLCAALNLEALFPNIYVGYDDKENFVARRVRDTDVVIFTGTPENANKVRRQFSRRTLFILNGAGHNPLVITESADIVKAIDSTLRVVLYNQGQDCAGPNAILVHCDVYENFRDTLLGQLSRLESKVGPYADPGNIVGPNSDPDHTVKVVQLFKELRPYCTYGGEINPITGLIRPTVMEKPLANGGNYTEFFAPVFFMQRYRHDSELSQYFEDPRYYQNAMYISAFGQSAYVDSLIETRHHDAGSILRNSDLHLEEKGYLPYGGQGPAASCLYVNGERICGPTLPQRDIYEHLVLPLMNLDQRPTVNS